ncbi:uncharacterized protein LOC113465148 [Ceratina calcarata]|uniref:Uncharacterized protein LOC113465148 n=1 Tax=Ceratina calcarata TaxID=156304 RepID=A0AAJ7SBA2_9HYME|nr:uncharacterized protein LOC113465148 [Ceratina calcarata]
MMIELLKHFKNQREFMEKLNRQFVLITDVITKDYTRARERDDQIKKHTETNQRLLATAQTTLSEIRIITEKFEELEAECKISETKASVAQREKTRENKDFRERPSTYREQKDVKCYRCNKFGHWQTECPLIEFGTWYCYYCNEYRQHKGDQCPKAPQRETE